MTEKPTEIPSFKTEIEWFKVRDKFPPKDSTILTANKYGRITEAYVSTLLLSKSDSKIYFMTDGFSFKDPYDYELFMYWAYLPKFNESEGI